MTVDKAEIEQLAELARLEIAPEQLESYAEDCQKILAYVEALSEVDVSEVEAMSHVHGVVNVYREDEQRNFENSEKLIEGVPDKSGTHIRVPLVIDQEN